MSDPKTFDTATPQDCLSIIEAIEQAGLDRARDRAVINNQFNGGRPFTPDEVKEHQIQVNVNFLEGYRVAQDANLQVNGALMNKDRFFNARCLGGDEEKRQQYSQKFTDCVHEIIKDGRGGKKHMTLLKNRNASLTLHGIGAMVWMNSYDWMPRFVSLDDLLIPTDATQDLDEELGHFAINARLTAYQLAKQTTGEHVDNGWNVPFVRKIIKGIRPLQTYTQDLTDRPEEWESLIKQHGLYMNSDAVPKIKVTYFFYQNNETGKWHRKIILRKNDAVSISSETTDDFIYDSGSEPFANNIEELIHVQYGDGNVVAPLKFHSVRGLGMLLYGVVELLNRFRCQFMQHSFEQLMTILRVNNMADRDRPKVLELGPYKVLEDGVSFVPQQERSQADPKIVEFAMSQNKQIMGEGSSAYVQDIDTGTRREQTLGEAKIKLQTANKIVGGMLSNMYLQEYFYYVEIVRRLLNENGSRDSIAFRKKCISKGIPSGLLIPSMWKVEVEKVFGMGDQTLAVDEVTALMSIIDRLDPSGKMVTLRKYISVITRNSDLANLLVPENPDQATDGVRAAEDVFGTLMLGVPVSLREGIEREDYVGKMLAMMAAVIDRINGTDGVGTPTDVFGLNSVAEDVSQNIEVMSQDPANKAFVAAAGKALGKLMNDVKAFAQRQQEAAKSNQQDPAELAKIEMLKMQSQVKAEIAQMQAELKSQLRQSEHRQKMMQAAESHALEMQIEGSRSAAEVHGDTVKTGAEISNLDAKTRAEIAVIMRKAEAEIEAIKAKAKASPKPDKSKVD